MHLSLLSASTSSSSMTTLLMWTLQLVGLILLLSLCLVLILLMDTLVRGWYECRRTRRQYPNLPPPLSFQQLQLVATKKHGSLSSSSSSSSATTSITIEGCFAAAQQWFRTRQTWSLEVPPPLTNNDDGGGDETNVSNNIVSQHAFTNTSSSSWFAVRRFVLVANDDLLKHVLVTHNGRYEKHHAHGILEDFRQTTLPDSGLEAWKETHKLISKFGRALPALSTVLAPMIDEWMDVTWGGAALSQAPSSSPSSTKSSPPPQPIDTAETVRDLYWKVVMILVLGDDAHADVYQEAWTTCMERLDSPSVFMFWWAKYLPTSLNRRYQQQTRQLRTIVREAVDRAFRISGNEPQCNNADKANDADVGLSPSPPQWTFLHQLVNQSHPSSRLSPADATEVLLEVLFTGASSVTTTLLWLLWQLATHKDIQAQVAKEVMMATSNVHVETSLLSSLSSSSTATNKMPLLDACIRETLRLYSPIHVGRHCIQDDSFEDIDIPKGTDITANMWFIHRNPLYWPDPNEFDPTRWLDMPTNIQYYHPFSMGMRGCPGKAVAYTMIKYVTILVLREWELEPMPDMPLPTFSGSVVLSNTPVQMYIRGTRRNEDRTKDQ